MRFRMIQGVKGSRVQGFKCFSPTQVGYQVISFILVYLLGVVMGESLQ